MFRIVCYPSSGSVERAWLKLLVIFFVCIDGVWQRDFEPAVCVPGTRHTHRRFKITLLSSRIDCFIRKRKVQQKHTMHVPKHCRHQFPRAGWCLEFFDGGRPRMLPSHGLCLCLRIVLVHPSFTPSNEFQLELSLLPTKTE